MSRRSRRRRAGARVESGKRGAGWPAFLRARKPVAFRFAGDGAVPNHPSFPLIVYRGAVDFPDGLDPAAVLEVLFAANGWGRAWRDEMYPFQHFHTRTHEVLGIARGRVRAQFGGGGGGRTLALRRGDVVVLPAGTGHRRRAASRNLLIVGAYPPGGVYDEPKPGDVDRAKAAAAIARVGPPPRDPVYGRDGPLRALWRRRRASGRGRDPSMTAVTARIDVRVTRGTARRGRCGYARAVAGQSCPPIDQENVMSTLTRALARASLVAGLALAAPLFLAAEPALALCKQGGPHCAPNWNNPGNHFYAAPKGPSDGWSDPDCKYYGNCKK